MSEVSRRSVPTPKLLRCHKRSILHPVRCLTFLQSFMSRWSWCRNWLLLDRGMMGMVQTGFTRARCARASAITSLPKSGIVFLMETQAQESVTIKKVAVVVWAQTRELIHTGAVIIRPKHYQSTKMIKAFLIHKVQERNPQRKEKNLD